MSVTVGGIRYSRSVIHFNTSHSLYSADNHMTRQTSVWKGMGCSSLPDDVIEPGSISEADLTADSKPRGKRRRKDGAAMPGGSFPLLEREKQTIVSDVTQWHPCVKYRANIFFTLHSLPFPTTQPAPPPLSTLICPASTNCDWHLFSAGLCET